MSTSGSGGGAGQRSRTVPTIYDIAQYTGLNASTVSRALRGTGRVSPDTSERVAQAARSLGYHANVLARGLTSGRTHTLAFVVADITNPMIFDVIRGAEREASRQGFTLVIAESRESQDVESDALRRLVPLIDGAIVAVSRLEDDALREVAATVPVTLIHRVVDGISSVVPEEGPSIDELLDHLTALGHTSFVYVAGPDRAWVSARRRDVISQRAAARGISVTTVGPYAPTREGGADATAAVLDTGATAVLAFNDLMGIGLLSGLRSRGLEVPRDLSVAGFDAIIAGEYTSPPLTTVRARHAELGEKAATQLLALVRGQEGAARIVPAPATSVVVRGSTGPAPTTRRVERSD